MTQNAASVYIINTTIIIVITVNTVITCKGAAPLVGLTESGHSSITGGDL